MEIKTHQNMANRSTDIIVNISDFETIQMREAVYRNIIDAVTEKFLELHGAEIIASVDKESLTAKINQTVNDKIFVYALNKLEIKDG